MSTFDIKQRSLGNLLEAIKNGKIQLPDFQREWVWKDEHIRSLIASVSQSFPIGVIMALEAKGEHGDFKTKLIKGVETQRANERPETLILDGQQRLTALFQTLMSDKPVFTKDKNGKNTNYYYYLDMEACLENGIEQEEAILSCRKNLQVQTTQGKIINITSNEDQYANNLFPVNKILESNDWMQKYAEYWNYNPKKMEFFFQFNKKIIANFSQYTVPLIQLSSETPKEAVCLIFEKVNTTGVTLTVFDLLTASFAVDGFDLREDWNKISKRMKKKFRVLDGLESSNFLKALTLFAANADPETTVSCTRRDILDLTLEDYKKWADKIEDGFEKAARFLHREKIFKAKDLPYPTQIVPLAAIFAELGDASDIPNAENKIARWFWCGVLGELYRQGVDSRFASDFSEVLNWITENGELPKTIRDASFHENRLPELQRRTSAAYKGLHALIMQEKDGTKYSDFLTERSMAEQVYFDDNIDIHHIFPRAWCQNQRIPAYRYNSIINKTALSAKTNRKIGGKAPSEYLRNIQQEMNIEPAEMDKRLEGHFICPTALRNNDFEAFFEARKEALINLIEKAMGKKVNREGAEPSDTTAQQG